MRRIAMHSGLNTRNRGSMLQGMALPSPTGEGEKSDKTSLATVSEANTRSLRTVDPQDHDFQEAVLLELKAIKSQLATLVQEPRLTNHSGSQPTHLSRADSMMSLFSMRAGHIPMVVENEELGNPLSPVAPRQGSQLSSVVPRHSSPREIVHLIREASEEVGRGRPPTEQIEEKAKPVDVEIKAKVPEVCVSDLPSGLIVTRREGPRLATAQQTPLPPMHWEAGFDVCDERMSLLDRNLRRDLSEMGLRSKLIRLTTSRYFDHVVGLGLILNAVVLGFQTDIEAKLAFGEVGAGDAAGSLRCFETLESIFCIFFTAEIIIRLFTYRCSFFTMQDRCWNVFDLTVCILWVTEQTTGLIHSVVGLSLNPRMLRVMQLLRVIRITRLIRIVRSVEQLKTLLSSILESLRTSIWTVTLLTMMIYMVGVLFTQVVIAEVHDQNEELVYWFSSLSRTCLTMFEVIAGGVSWDSVIAPVIEEVSPAMGILFVLYVAFSVFAMTNIITGIFVESAMSKASEDKDQNTANHIRDLFFNDSEVEVDQVVTFETFQQKMGTPEMRDYFRAINVDPSEAKGLFRLIDVDASGSVDAEELVNGCLRLRGGAKALDLSLLMYETSLVYEAVLVQNAKIEELLAQVGGTPRSKRQISPSKNSTTTN